MSKPLRILYAAGPGNVIGTYNHWVKGEDDPTRVSVTYSGQFYDACKKLNAEAYIIASRQDEVIIKDGQFTLEHRLMRWQKAGKILYHLGHLWYGLRLIATTLRFRADVAIVADGTTYWFLLSLLSWWGVTIIPSIHCVLWHKYSTPSKKEQLLLNLNRRLFRQDCAAILVVSDIITQQISQLTENQHQPITRFSPIYRLDQFTSIAKPDLTQCPFRVLFVGRVEHNKGVFDLLEVAQQLVAEGRKDIVFDVCGDGSALESLRLAVKEAGMECFFICHGYCQQAEMREMYGQSHVVIVPTRTNFVEGFNKVVVEGVLASRPVITSAVCPALSDVKEAVFEVPPNSIEGYTQAIRQLRDDQELYKAKCEGQQAVQAKFYDRSRGWGAKLTSYLSE
ncbi:MAG: glycosyltransferase [Jaaginema sp. PMC 1079.18]|nr:glycosyltransferase [Jaaginema sp. PMC 1080.18]MEC4850729.1 glycosyltransferase [Jaaginema sp. PMC 1079.18]MEC4865283.1 glycosyltransferase [Jaaginema sp. PMC 1078.18]